MEIQFKSKHKNHFCDIQKSYWCIFNYARYFMQMPIEAHIIFTLIYVTRIFKMK